MALDSSGGPVPHCRLTFINGTGVFPWAKALRRRVAGFFCGEKHFHLFNGAGQIASCPLFLWRKQVFTSLGRIGAFGLPLQFIHFGQQVALARCRDLGLPFAKS